MSNDFIRQVADTYFGGVKGMAKACGVSRAMIWRWGKKGVPRARCYQIHHLTGRKVTLEQLNPSLFKVAA